MKDTTEKSKERAELVAAELGDEIHVRQEECAQLLAARTALIELYGIDYTVTEAGKAAVQTRGRKPGRGEKTKAAAAEPTANGATVKAPSGELVKLAAAMRSAPEPFTQESLRVSTGLDAMRIKNALFNWKNKGWLAKVARGEFKRTADFPAE